MVDRSKNEDQMAAEVMEVVELDNGDVALRRADDETAEPVISIRLCAESLGLLPDAQVEIAHAMIAAGVQAIAGVREKAAEDVQPPVLH